MQIPLGYKFGINTLKCWKLNTESLGSNPSQSRTLLTFKAVLMYRRQIIPMQISSLPKRFYAREADRWSSLKTPGLAKQVRQSRLRFCDLATLATSSPVITFCQSPAGEGRVIRNTSLLQPQVAGLLLRFPERSSLTKKLETSNK